MDHCIQLGRGDLRVWLGEPGTYHKRSRFDWTGFIPQLSLNGHTFCTPESSTWNPKGSGGEGFCGEFRVDEQTMGWDDTDAFFLKPGVGLLERKDDKPYSFGTEYPIVKPFPCEYAAGDDYADIFLDAIPLKGIAYRMNKHISVLDNLLMITTTITNTGQKSLYFREYNHNFLSMDGLGAHEDVCLTLNKPYRNSVETPGLVMHENHITFTDSLKGSFMIYCDAPAAYAPMRWELRDKKAGLAVQEWGDFPVTGFLAWGGPHVIAPEIYGDFPVAPGQSRTWTRVWKFFDSISQAK